jgi:hypothetical protein
MAVWDRKRTKNPKTQTIRKLMDEQGGKITLLWVSGHVGITNNENADTATKKALTERIQSTEKHSKPQKVDRTETSTGATKIMEHHDNRDQPTHNKLLQNNTRNDHEP